MNKHIKSAALPTFLTGAATAICVPPVGIAMMIVGAANIEDDGDVKEIGAYGYAAVASLITSVSLLGFSVLGFLELGCNQYSCVISPGWAFLLSGVMFGVSMLLTDREYRYKPPVPQMWSKSNALCVVPKMQPKMIEVSEDGVNWFLVEKGEAHYVVLDAREMVRR